MTKKTIFNDTPLESNLIKKIESYIKRTYKQDAWFFKTVGNASQKSGIPDVLCCIKGKFIAIEAKREDGSGRASKQQEIECRKIINAGGYAIISDNFDCIKVFIDNMCK